MRRLQERIGLFFDFGAVHDAPRRSLENPLPPKHPLSTMRQNRVLDLYIGNLIAGTAIEPVKEWLEGLVTAVRESLPPESPGRILLAESPDGQFESYIRSCPLHLKEKVGQASPQSKSL